jgi:magnesium chelatase subunit I
MFGEYFPSPDKVKKNQEANPYQSITAWFSKNNHIDLFSDLSNVDYKNLLCKVPGLMDLVKKHHPKASEDIQFLLMEFVLHGLSEYSLLSKYRLETGVQFKDMISSMFTMNEDEDEDFNSEFFK